MFWVFVAPFPTSTPEMRPKVRVSGVGWLPIAGPPSPSALARKMRHHCRIFRAAWLPKHQKHTHWGLFLVFGVLFTFPLNTQNTLPRCVLRVRRLPRLLSCRQLEKCDSCVVLFVLAGYPPLQQTPSPNPSPKVLIPHLTSLPPSPLLFL